MKEEDLMVKRQDLFNRMIEGQLSLENYLEKVAKIDLELQRIGYRFK